MTENEKRKGRQTPTTSHILPYTDTLGNEAVAFYNHSGRKAQEWQELQLADIMAITEEHLWSHMKYGYALPRRNGKSEILIMRAEWGVQNGERILYTAHRTTTSHNAWEKVLERLTKAGFQEDTDFKTRKGFGLEVIEWLTGAGVINFRTRSSKGGLGEGYDLLIIDEAQEYTSDQETALKYVVTDSKNPQTIMCGTPPTVVSAGTVFLEYRRDTLQGDNEDCGWAEWSVPELTDAHDIENWYATNPSLGSILTERAIRNELGKDQVDDNIQRLGLWLSYNQKSAISREEWRETITETTPVIDDNTKFFVGIKFSRSLPTVSVSVAFKTPDEHIFVEVIDCRPTRDGNEWIMPYLRNTRVKEIVIDGASGQSLLESDIKNHQIKAKIILPKVIEVIESASLFENHLFNGTLLHKDQPSLEQAIANCDHRAIGAAGGYGYTSILEGADISLVESIALAHWACATAKTSTKKQTASY